MSERPGARGQLPLGRAAVVQYDQGGTRRCLEPVMEEVLGLGLSLGVTSPAGLGLEAQCLHSSSVRGPQWPA